ncbi:MAG: tetratricopeptide repeat protein, partial [Bacteroidales bacterium]|nr:tetratricopeptide repeat protein [Bacteroidales bacterium]
MSNNDEFDIDEEEFAELLEKCELMFATKSEVYFDVHEFIDLIDCYMTQQEADKVTKLFSYAQKQHGSNSEIELRKALFDLARNYIDNAIQKLQQLLVVEPNNTEITINLSSAYIQNENPDTALHYLEQAIATNPDEEEEFAAFICPAFVAHGYCDIAQNILEKTLKKNPHNIELLYQLGLCYNTANNTEKSIELFKTILQSEPYSFDAWFGLGVAYWQREQFSEAIESLD